MSSRHRKDQADRALEQAGLGVRPVFDRDPGNGGSVELLIDGSWRRLTRHQAASLSVRVREAREESERRANRLAERSVAW